MCICRVISYTPTPSSKSVVASSAAFLTNKRANQVTVRQPAYRLKSPQSLPMRGKICGWDICRFYQITNRPLHTNLVNYDYYQDTSQTVGLSKTAVLIKSRETNSNTVLVDSGDTIQGTPLGLIRLWLILLPKAERLTLCTSKAFEMLGYDAGSETLGNHEFNYGLEFLDRMVKAAKH